MNHFANHLSLLLLEVAAILAVARVAGNLSRRLGQPEVLGELVMGVLIGAVLSLALPSSIYTLIQSSTDGESHLAILGELGILLLLFGVGLDSRPRDLLRVGLSSLSVACVGMFLPLALGFLVCSVLTHDVPETVKPWQMHLFVGAAMAATSVGVTARVLADIRRIHGRESRIILGAAVLDDIGALVLLAVVTALIGSDGSQTVAMSWQTVVLITVRAIGFVVIGTMVGSWIFSKCRGWFVDTKYKNSQILSLLIFCFVFSALAELAGLAALVGAFLAGLVIDTENNSSKECIGSLPIDKQILAPITSVLAPIFFVLMGMQVDISSVVSAEMLLYTLAITLVAILGKIVAGAFVSGSWNQKAFIGAGMVPRGEVGLIFAAVGQTVGAFGSQTYSSLVFMIIFTTIIAPSLLSRLAGNIQEDND